MSDPAKTSLPLQLGGFAALALGCAFRSWPAAWFGLGTHFAGDIWFFFQLRAMGFFK